MGFNRAGDSGFGLFPNVCHVQINNQACSTAGRALPRYTSRPDVACNVIVKGISIEHTRRRRHPPSLSHLPLSLADACWARACAATFSLQGQPSSLPAPLTDSLVVLTFVGMLPTQSLLTFLKETSELRSSVLCSLVGKVYANIFEGSQVTRLK